MPLIYKQTINEHTIATLNDDCGIVLRNIYLCIDLRGSFQTKRVNFTVGLFLSPIALNRSLENTQAFKVVKHIPQNMYDKGSLH